MENEKVQEFLELFNSSKPTNNNSINNMKVSAPSAADTSDINDTISDDELGVSSSSTHLIDNGKGSAADDNSNFSEGKEDKEDKEDKGGKLKKDWRKSYEDTEEYKNDLQRKSLLEYEAKIKELKEWEDDEGFKLLKIAKEKGISLIDAIKEISTEDVSQMTTKDLFMKKIERYKDKLTEEQIEDALYKFENMDALSQLEATEAIRQEIEADRKSKLDKFQSSKKEIFTEAQINIVKKFEEELDSLFNKLNGNVWRGVKYTPSLLRKIEKAIVDEGLISPVAYMREDGTFDPVEALEAVSGLKQFRNLMKKNEIDLAASKAVENVLRVKSNVSNGIRENGLPKETDKNASMKSAIKEFFKN